MTKRWSLLSLCILATSSLAGQAASDTTRLPDRAVTATKADVVTGVAPAATTILYGAELRARGMTFVTDALREVPGIMIVSNGGYGTFTSLFMRGGESDYVKVLLDGIPLNQPGGSIDPANLTLDNIERIEIVRGPGSVLHGADAVSGVIQLFTTRGSRRATSDVGYSRGTFGNETYNAGVSGMANTASYSLGGSQFKSNGIYPFNSRYQDRTFSGQLGRQGPAGDRSTLTARYESADAHYPTDYTGVPVDSNQVDITRGLVLGLDLVRPLSPYALVTLHGFGSRLRRNSFNPPDSPGDSVGFGFDADRGAVTWRRGADARLDLMRSSGARTSLGLAWEQETEEQSSRTGSNFGTGYFEETGSFSADRTTTSAYGQLYATPTPFFTAQFGTRIDHNTAFGDIVTWRGGLSLLRRSGWRGWVSAGTAFKAPTFSELFAKGGFEVGNPDLKPEKTNNIELGIGRAIPGARGTYSLTVFRQRFRDLIQFVDAAPGESNYINLGGVDVQGLELAFGLKVSTRLTARATLGWLKTEVTDTGAKASITFAQGQSLLRRPGRSGSLTLAWKAGKADLTGVVSFIGKRDDVDYRNSPASRTTLPSYQTVDLSLTWPLRPSSGRDSAIDLLLRGENLLDAEYEQVAAFRGRGRTLFAGVRLHQ